MLGAGFAEVPQYAGHQKSLRSRELPVVIVERL